MYMYMHMYMYMYTEAGRRNEKKLKKESNRCTSLKVSKYKQHYLLPSHIPLVLQEALLVPL